MRLPSNVILVGFMGSGKTLTGKELAEVLNFIFLDTDQWIEEKNKKKVREIFEEKGEVYFRNQEKNIINELRSKQGYVIATGGGIWANKENRETLLKMGWCVWLKVSAKVAWQRVGENLSQRPLLNRSSNPLKTMEKILNERKLTYLLAHESFDTNRKSPKDVAHDIFQALKREKPFDFPEADVE